MMLIFRRGRLTEEHVQDYERQSIRLGNLIPARRVSYLEEP